MRFRDLKTRGKVRHKMAAKLSIFYLPNTLEEMYIFQPRQLDRQQPHKLV